jgi:hypothetical protein
MQIDLTDCWKVQDFGEQGRSILHMGIDARPYVYVNIPKNASSWLKTQIDGVLFNYINQHVAADATYIVALRDPVERWLAGAAQSFVGCSPENEWFFLNLGFNAIFDHVVFDEHTAPQSTFLSKIDFKKVVWFKCSSNLETNWNHWAKDKIVPAVMHTGRWDNPDNPYNISSKGLVPEQFPSRKDNTTTVSGWSQRKIHTMLRKHLTACPDHLEQLKWYYRECYELIDSVKFYKAR